MTSPSRLKPMADYGFYTDVYLGSTLSQKTFPEFAQRAKEELERLQRNYQVTIPGEDSLRMAICAMAESLYTHAKRRGGVIAASAGEVSVRYEDSGEQSLRRELYRKAATYLDIHRGVSV